MMDKQKRFGNVSQLSERRGKKSVNLLCNLLIINSLQNEAVGKETSL